MTSSSALTTASLAGPDIDPGLKDEKALLSLLAQMQYCAELLRHIADGDVHTQRGTALQSGRAGFVLWSCATGTAIPGDDGNKGGWLSSIPPPPSGTAPLRQLASEQPLRHLGNLCLQLETAGCTVYAPAPAAKPPGTPRLPTASAAMLADAALTE